jgi:hypothetical protein
MFSKTSAEAEFRANTRGVCKMLWLKILLKELGYDSKDSTWLYCDNKAANHIDDNPIQYDQTKHVDINKHFANILDVFHTILNKLGMPDLLPQLEGEC